MANVIDDLQEVAGKQRTNKATWKTLPIRWSESRAPCPGISTPTPKTWNTAWPSAVLTLIELFRQLSNARP